MLYLAAELLHIWSLFNIIHRVLGTSKSIKKKYLSEKIAVID